MDVMFDIAYLNSDPNCMEPDIPQLNEDVWVLGKKYNAIQDLERIRRDVTSIIWCTYRKGFVPIGDDGFTSDKGWGCMLRCGQMLLAMTLTRIHLIDSWIWRPETRDPTYLKIIQRFEERKQAPYSIHQIALMGACEGRNVGQWLGPNTVAQVLKKLVVYDKWSSVYVHIALDNTVVLEDMLRHCVLEQDMKHGETSQTNTIKNNSEEGCNVEGGRNVKRSDWKPLLLIIPLRLGLNEINSVYINGLKQCFQMPQSLGIIGGKPNQALYIIGYIGDEALYLDPHTTQKSGFIENKETDDQKEIDASYHCKYASRISFEAMDPSVAVCFLCKSRKELDELCDSIRNRVMNEQQPLFELVNERPDHWGPPESDSKYDDLDDIDRQFDDSDDEFELI